jgi:hypothetical protein
LARQSEVPFLSYNTPRRASIDFTLDSTLGEISADALVCYNHRGYTYCKRMTGRITSFLVLCLDDMSNYLRKDIAQLDDVIITPYHDISGLYL